MTRDNSGRTQIPPEVFEQFMKQQEQKAMQAAQAVPQPVQPTVATVNVAAYNVPTDFVDLPSEGRFYPQNHPWHNKKTIEVRFMTTKEEDIITSPSYVQRGVVFDKLIESVSVDRVLSKTLLPGDKLAVILNCRKNAYGDEYEFKSICQNCSAVYNKTIKISEIKNLDIDFEAYNITDRNTFVVEAPISKATVEFKLFDSEDEEYINNQIENRKKHNLPEDSVATTHRRLIVSVNGDTNPNTINSFANSLLIRDSRYLQKCYVAVKPDVNTTYEHTCEECGYDNQGGMPLGAGFFWIDD
tara:strand:+ start:1088 stop:1984 length:897 start_codon:yes stop_codon:yes gene_type:complete